LCGVMVNGTVVDGVNGLCVWCNGLSGNIKCSLYISIYMGYV